MNLLADKTIKELAEEIGVTKQAIWQKIKKESSTSLRQFTSTKGNTVYVSVDGQNLIKSMFKSKSSTNRQQENVNVDVNKSSTKSHTEVDFLREQLIAKNEEMKNMQRLLDQQQQLTLQSNKRIEKLEAQLQLGSNVSEEDPPSAEEQSPVTDPDPVPDKKWWHFLRRDM